jgi:hypothetical protein
MGIYADLQAQAKSFKLTSPLGRYLESKIGTIQLVDPPSPSVAAVTNAVHTIAQDGTDHTGGTFKLVMTLRDGSVISTAAIAYNANAATIETAIDAAADGQDEVQSIAKDATDHTGGTFALTVNLRTTTGIESFTTAAIAYNANAATIETAIDVAATAAAVTGWVNGAISVSGGILQAAGAPVVLTFDGTAVDDQPHPLVEFDGALLTGGTEPSTRVSVTTPGSTVISGWAAGHITVTGGILQAAGADVVLTFDGTSVAGDQHSITVFDGALLTGGAEPATRVTVTTTGQTARPAWGFLHGMDVISGTIPDQTDAASTTAVTAGSNLLRVPDVIVIEAAREAAAEDNNNASYFSIMLGLGYQDKAPQAEHVGEHTDV